MLVALVLGNNNKVVTDSYIDNIDLTKELAEEIVDHLKKFGLVVKPPESLEWEAILGPQLKKGKTEILVLKRGNKVPEVDRNYSQSLAN